MFVWLAAHRPPSLQVVRFLSRKVVEDLRGRFTRALARGLEMLPGVRVEDREGNDMRAYGWLRGTTSEIVLSSRSINDDQSRCPRHREAAMAVQGFERQLRGVKTSTS
ncbi:hypothetical protein HETIRDRAFT_454075 [Heterobasidion irregulare TC 32-1]|uniref:Uncharacterized protein n=1 Tax=Heterobasidion irregulare (strain TC 32-1) TaxID=747525 RepID=W4JWR4_HETIT|nr:uncharacterized protein HETIRDRAFT_454075 [Heterobasidion irregulare TC 32-1]ETW78008.1 hypothetical protein HETIRDRAFT_454075 [Heterobasidion irregulare TC 32-1]